MKYYKIKDNPNLFRDSDSNVIVNTNMKEYNEYVARKNSKNKRFEKIDELESDLKDLKNDIDEIKNLLRRFVDGKA
jgi:tetrahydromethanopterin S-methyltransferase subunit B